MQPRQVKVRSNGKGGQYSENGSVKTADSESKMAVSCGKMETCGSNSANAGGNNIVSRGTSDVR